MTDRELARAYYQAVENTVQFGTGFIKVSLVDGKLEVSVVDPRDYKYIEPLKEEL